MGVVETGRPKYRFDREAGVEQLRLPARRTWFGSAFLGTWLLLWAWAGGRAAMAHIDDPATVVWLAIWVLVLVGTSVWLAGQLIGVDIVTVRQGELVIVRRAGPFSRTWRYRTGLIAQLRINAGHWTGERIDGAQYIPFIKQQWGSVRFDYGAETIHLAPHVDDPEASRIFAWLQQRLPVSAACSPAMLP